MLNAASLKLNGGPIRFSSVNGYDGRTNDILYSPPKLKPGGNDEQTAVVYFGGDVQVMSVLLIERNFWSC